MASAVRNVIFDLGGVVLDWNPDRIVSRFQSVEELRASFKDALFGHADWRMFDRGTLTELQLIDRLEVRLGRTRQEVTAILDAVRQDKSKPNANRSVDSPVSVGVQLPPAIALKILPETALAQAPAAKTLQYTMIENQVVLVDPTNMRVVDIISP